MNWSIMELARVASKTRAEGTKVAAGHKSHDTVGLLIHAALFGNTKRILSSGTIISIRSASIDSSSTNLAIPPD